MINPVINLYRTTDEAFYFKNSPINDSFIFGGIHLLPNNNSPYIQVTNTPDGINLEDWTVKGKTICGTFEADITSSFMVIGLTNSLDGNPQIIWQLKNVPIDFGFKLIYLEITQSLGETFYSTPFMLTNINSDRTTQIIYNDDSDQYQSIGFKFWFRQLSEKEELTNYYETSTRHTVTVELKTDDIEQYQTEFIALSDLKQLSRILRSKYVYVNNTRCSLMEAPSFPETPNRENFGRMSFNFSMKYEDTLYL